MSAPVWAQPFPGGVADAELQHALWRSGTGQVVALSLADGRVLWRSAEPLWPLLLGHGLALGLATATSRVVALPLQGDGAGRECWRSDPLPWPDGAASPPGNAASVLHAAWMDERILLRWQLRPLYAGGAPPGRSRARPAPSVGSCLLDADTGALQRAPTDVGGPAPQVPPQLPSDDPDVLAQALLGGVIYRLQRQPLAGDKVQIELIAHDTRRGLDLWASTLEEARPDPPGKGPRALRC
jgi:hypothetical protein